MPLSLGDWLQTQAFGDSNSSELSLEPFNQYNAYLEGEATKRAAGDSAFARRARSPYATLYGLTPIRNPGVAPQVMNPYTGQMEGPSGYAESKWGVNNPVRLPPELVSYLDKNVGESWDEGLAGALDKVQLDTSRGGFGANYQRQTQALSDFLGQIDDPSVKRYASSLSNPGNMQSLSDYATMQSKSTKADQWKSGLMAASVMSGPLLSAAGQGLSSFLAPALGEAAPIASSALIGTGKGLLSNAIMSGVTDDMPMGSSQSMGSSVPEPGTQTTAQSPLSESVMTMNQTTPRRPRLIRLSPGFSRGAY